MNTVLFLFFLFLLSVLASTDRYELTSIISRSAEVESPRKRSRSCGDLVRQEPKSENAPSGQVKKFKRSPEEVVKFLLRMAKEKQVHSFTHFYDQESEKDGFDVNRLFYEAVLANVPTKFLEMMLDHPNFDLEEQDIFAVTWRALRSKNLVLIRFLLNSEVFTREPRLIKECLVEMFSHITYSKNGPTNDQIGESIKTCLALLGETGDRILADYCFYQIGFDRKRLRNILLKLKIVDREVNIKMVPELPFIGHFLARVSNDVEKQGKFILDNYDIFDAYNKLIYFFPAPLITAFIRTYEDDPQMFKLNPSTEVFMKFWSEENPDGCPSPIDKFVHCEERFWFNCLFDNYQFLIEPIKSYEGSVVIRRRPKDEDGPLFDPPIMLYPSFNEYFLEHALEIKEEFTLEDDEEIERVELLYKYYTEIAESGHRFAAEDSKRACDLIAEKIKALEPGETYALDIYTKKSAKPTCPGHLVIGLITKNEPVEEAEEYSGDEGTYNIRIFNTGYGFWEVPGLDRRCRAYTDMINVPEDILLDFYVYSIPCLRYFFLEKYLKPEEEYDPVDFCNTSRQQKGNTCSEDRVWTTTKVTCEKVDLYMEIKTAFVCAFLARLRQDFKGLVVEKWDSPRKSFWWMVASTPFLERNLMRQLARCREPERRERLKQRVDASMAEIHNLSI